MLELALWLKRNGFRADQVQAFLPSPMASATAMYHTGNNPLRAAVSKTPVSVPKSRGAAAPAQGLPALPRSRQLADCCATRCGAWAASDLIGNGKQHLVPRWQPAGTGRRGRGPAQHPPPPADAPRRPGRSPAGSGAIAGAPRRAAVARAARGDADPAHRPAAGAAHQSNAAGQSRVVARGPKPRAGAAPHRTRRSPRGPRHPPRRPRHPPHRARGSPRRPRHPPHRARGSPRRPRHPPRGPETRRAGADTRRAGEARRADPGTRRADPGTRPPRRRPRRKR